MFKLCSKHCVFAARSAHCTQMRKFETDTVPGFLEELVDKFGETELKPNMHLLTHLAHNVRLHGPPTETNMFAAERAYGDIARPPSSNRLGVCLCVCACVHVCMCVNV